MCPFFEDISAGVVSCLLGLAFRKIPQFPPGRSEVRPALKSRIARLEKKGFVKCVRALLPSPGLVFQAAFLSSRILTNRSEI